jgi:VWFA-related protein
VRPISLLVCSVLCAAQETTIRQNVPLVLIPVTVTDNKGQFIEGLTAGDFVVRDDGKAQMVFLDTPDTVLAPVAMVIAIQTSNITAPALAKIRQVGSIVQPLMMGERGQAAIIAYDAEPRILQALTGDSAKIREVFSQLQARLGKKAVLLDTVAQAVKMLETRPPSYRRVLLILGESRDRGSLRKIGPVVQDAQRSGIEVYAITFSAQKVAWTARPEDNPPLPPDSGPRNGNSPGMPRDPGNPNNPNNTNSPNYSDFPNYAGGIVELARLGKSNAAAALADATGGRHLSFATLGGLEAALNRTGQEIHNRYLLSFVPVETNNIGFHRIEVQVPHRTGAVIRARPGYWPRR